MTATFIVFSAAVVGWCLCALRWILSPRGRGRNAAIVMTYIAAASAIVSIVADVRTFHMKSVARDSALDVRIIRRGDWWQIEYEHSGVAFTTANELHVPAGTIVSLTWSGSPPPRIDGSLCFSRRNSCALVTGPARRCDASFFHALPWVHERLQVFVDSDEEFERWFRNEASGARPSPDGPALFASAGCSYCHVIRGVVSSPSRIAPDLTHFASRTSIAGTRTAISRANLTAWIADSQGLKPGSAMPPNAIDPVVLHRLVGYVASLR